MTMMLVFERSRVMGSRTCGVCDNPAWVDTTLGFRCERHAAEGEATGDLVTVCDWARRRRRRARA